MKHYKTEAVILDTTDVFDADRSLLLFTRELGKVRARARGVRRPTSRLTGHLLSYVPTQLELVESAAGSLTITQAQIVGRAEDSTYPDNPILFLQLAGRIAEAINKLYVDNEAHPSVYDGLVYTLERLLVLCQEPEGGAKAELVAGEFLFKALVELGYRAELDHCVVTGETLNPKDISWSSALGGLLSTEGRREAGNEVVWKVKYPQAIVALRQFLKAPFFAERLTMPDDVRSEALGLVYDYLQYHIGQPLKSLSGTKAIG